MNSLIRSAATAGVCLGFIVTSHAQFNSWTKSTSGYWEEPFWSLGVLPDYGQSGVLLTNEGWKAVGIRRETALNHPASLHVQRLTVASPTNSFNTLLLNFVGNESPLQIADYFEVGTGSAFVTLDSGVQVGSEFRISGTVTHADQSTVSAPTVFIGHAGTAAYNLTNGILNVSTQIFVGYNYAGTLHQHGGSNVARWIRLWKGGEYFLHQGDVASGNISVGESSAGYFHQSDGRVLATNQISIGTVAAIWAAGDGRYTLSGGTLTTPVLVVGSANGSSVTPGANGLFEQSGGSNIATVVLVDGFTSTSGRYSLAGGLLSTSGSSAHGHASFAQSGGAHLIEGDLSVHGEYWRSFQAVYAGYTLSNGLLRARNLSVRLAGFAQDGGTNEVANNLQLDYESHASSSYYLRGGRLNTSNSIVINSRFGGFTQTGGVHSVSGTLQLVGVSSSLFPGPNSPIVYLLGAGQLIVRDILVTNGAAFWHTGGTISHSGKLTLAGGQWQSAPGTHQFGTVQLNAGVTNSTLSLPDSGVVLRFANSSNLPWQDDAKLVIRNWRGSQTGGGLHQIIFAGGSGALTPQQRARIVFREPAGFGAGDYPARLLPSGELVPAPRVGLLADRSANGLVIQWPQGFGYVLQTSTNLGGPWTDVAGAASPYTNQVTSGSRRFFRMRLFE
jgi:hypothetical protein